MDASVLRQATRSSLAPWRGIVGGVRLCAAHARDLYLDREGTACFGWNRGNPTLAKLVVVVLDATP